MSSHFHAVIRLDHNEVCTIRFGTGANETEVMRPEHAPRHLHAKAGSASGTHLHGQQVI